MKWFCIQSALLVLLIFGQVGVDKPKIEAQLDPYRNFVGTWRGKTHVTPGTDPLTVNLTITEETKAGRARWDYVWGAKGQRGYSKMTRFMVLKPSEEELLFYWEGAPEDRYKSRGLSHFNETGFGEFVARSLGSSTGPIDFLTFRLEESKLTYIWEETKDGTTFLRNSTFSFTRVAGGSGNQHPAL